MNITPIVKATQKFVIDNSPGILTGFGVAGAVTAAVLTGRAAFRVGFHLSNAIEKETPNFPAPQTTQEKVKLYWKEFVPAGVVLAGTVVCIVGATTVSSRRTAAITAAFKLSEELAEGYKKKVVDTIGTQKEEKIRADLAKDRVETAGGTSTFIIVGSEVVFHDALSGRLFKNEMAKVEKAVNEINSQINNFYCASLTEFYEKIGLSGTPFSDEVGWNSDQLLEPKYTATIVDDKPVISIELRTAPIRGFDRCM